MTLTQIKQKVIYYFQQAGLSPGFLQDSDDMILIALNEARKKAELLYAFERNRKTLSSPVVTASVDWTTLDERGVSATQLTGNIVVAGSGFADANQVYTPGGLVNGKLFYTASNGALLYWLTSGPAGWYIYSPNLSSLYYNTTDSDSPHTGSWLVVPARPSPAPIVTQESAAVSVSRPVRSLKKLWYVSDSGLLVHLPTEYANLVEQENADPSERLAFITGTTLRIWPELSGNELVVDGYVWMNEYDSYSDTDWMVEHGSSYLFWAVVQDLNHRFKEFVPRQEGNVMISDAVVTDHLQRLVAWDGQTKNGFFNQLD